MMADLLQDLLRRAETWPLEDQEAFAEFARELEARRSGVYRLSSDECAAIARAREGDYVPDEDMDAYWRRHDVA